MPRRVREEDLNLVVDVVRQSANGARRIDIAKALVGLPQRTVQYWLKNLVDDGRLTQEGKGPAARYRLPRAAEEEQKETKASQAIQGEEKVEEAVVPLSAESEQIREYQRHPSYTDAQMRCLVSMN